MLRAKGKDKAVGMEGVHMKKMKLIVVAVAVLTLLVVFIGMALQPAAAQYTSLLAAKFDVADFTFSSSAYVQGVFVEFNTSATTDLILLSSMNIKKLSAFGTTTEVWTKVTVDGTGVVLEERLRSVEGKDEGSTGTKPAIFSVGPGQHNISMEFNRTTGATIEINDIDINLGHLVTTAGGTVRGQLIKGGYNHSSTSFTPALNWTVNKTVASHTFIASKQTAQGTTPAQVDYYFENLNYSGASPYWSRYLSSADDVGSMSGFYIESETNGTQNYTIQSKTDAGIITVNYTLLDFDLRDNATRPINNFSVSDNLTNVTTTHNYSAGTHLMVNKTVTMQNGTGVFLAMTSSFSSKSGAQTLTYFINATGVSKANCSSKKERYLSGNDDIGNTFIYTICDNLTTGNTYTFNLWLQVPTGETVEQFDESFSGFEITPFDITQIEVTTDLSINKSDDRDPVLAGTTLTYTLNVINNGPNDAATVNVTDTLPENVSFHSASPSQNGSSGQVYWWEFSTISVGSYELITINVTVNSSTVNGTILKNTANVTSATPDSVSGNNIVSENTSVPSNAWPAAAQTWPTSWTWIDSDPNENDWQDDFRDVKNAYYNYDEEYLYLRMCCWANATLTSPNQEGRFKWFIDLDHNAHEEGGNIINGEYLLFVEDTDPNDGTGDVYLLNDTDSDGYFDDDWGKPTGGNYSTQNITNPSIAGYRITGKCIDLYVRLANITNPSNLSLVWATDQENPNLDQAPTTDHPDSTPIGPLCIHCAPVFSLTKYDFPDPIGVGENLTYTIIYENTGNMNATNVTITEVYDANVTFVNATPAPYPGTGNTTWTIPSLPVDGIHYINITVRVNDTVTNNTLLTNFVNITSEEGIENNHTVYTEVVGEPVLVITKYAWPDPVRAGKTLTYTILYENVGTVAVDNTNITDELPPRVTFISASPVPTNTSNDNHTLVWNIGTLPPNELRNITISVTVNVPFPCGCNLTDYVNITADDVDEVNQTAVTKVCSAPVLEIEKFDSPDPVEAGGLLNYTIYVNNTGCDNATNVTITEVYDANVTFVTSNPLPGPGNNTWNFPSITACESETITITVRVISPLPDGTVLVNYVNVTADKNLTDRVYQDTTVTSAPYLIISKADWPDPVKAGENLTYFIIYENTGNMNATNVTIREVYDDNVTFVTADSPPKTGTDNTTWTIGTLAPDGKHYINITVSVNDTDTILHNYVNITSDQVENNDTEDTEVVDKPILVLCKQDYPDPVVPGENLTYTICYENVGSTNATNTNITDTLPPEVTFISASPVPTNTSNDNHTLVWNIGNLTPNNRSTITINVSVNFPLPCGCNLTNYVNITSDVGEENDTEVTTICSAPVLEIVKLDSPDPVQVGALLNYTIYVNNTGCANATNVTVTDEVSMANVTHLASDPPPNTSGNNTWTWTNLSITAGESMQINITVIVDTLPPYGLLFDFVNVTCDQNVTANKWVLTDVISPNIVDPKIAEDLNGPPLLPGDIICYTLWINNTGNADSNDNPGNEFNDSIPENTTYNTGSLQINDVNESDNITDGIGYDAVNETIIWNGNITAGCSIKIRFCVTVDTNVTTGMVIANQGTVFYDSNGNGTNDAHEPTDDPGTEEVNDPTNLVIGFIPPMPVPTITPVGMIALVGLLSVIVAITIRRRRGKG